MLIPEVNKFLRDKEHFKSGNWYKYFYSWKDVVLDVLCEKCDIHRKENVRNWKWKVFMWRDILVLNSDNLRMWVQMDIQ